MIATNSDKVNGDGSNDVQLTGRTLTTAMLIWVILTLLVAGLYIWALSSWNLSQQDFPLLILIPLGYFASGLIIF